MNNAARRRLRNVPPYLSRDILHKIGQGLRFHYDRDLHREGMPNRMRRALNELKQMDNTKEST